MSRRTKLGGEVAKVAKENLEYKLNKSIISENNNLGYKYDNKEIDLKQK